MWTNCLQKVAELGRGGTLWMKSLREVGELLNLSSVPAISRKLPQQIIEHLRSSNSNASIQWFGSSKQYGVFILQIEAACVQPHAIVVDTKRKLIHDSAQPTLLKLSTEVLLLVVTCGGGRDRIIAGREIFRRRRHRK